MRPPSFPNVFAVGPQTFFYQRISAAPSFPNVFTFLLWAPQNNFTEGFLRPHCRNHWPPKNVGFPPIFFNNRGPLIHLSRHHGGKNKNRAYFSGEDEFSATFINCSIWFLSFFLPATSFIFTFCHNFV